MPGISTLSNMKNMYKTNMFRIRLNLDNFHDLFLVKGGTPLVNIVKSLFIVAGARITNGRIRFATHFIVKARGLLRTQGRKGLVKYLKSSTVLVQQYLGGQRISDLAGLGPRVSRTRSGLPRWIPPLIRRQLFRTDTVAAKLILTLSNFYRVIQHPGQLKLQTITAPGKGEGQLDLVLKSHIKTFLNLFIFNRFTKESLYKALENFSRESLFAIFKSSPGVVAVLNQWSTKPIVLLRSILALQNDSALWDALMIIWEVTKPQHILMAARQTGEYFKVNSMMGTQVIRPIPYLGKLGIKEEAAGKRRVFAMVDAWTQWTLYPLHRLYFMILEAIKMDGTFNQQRPIQHMTRSRRLYSLDLTAATDRIPVWLQKALLAALLDNNIAGAWAILLVGRKYRLQTVKGNLDLQYAVGQPMGALSSWASLALVHHFLVQAAAWEAGFPRDRLYTNYAILGDDIVIGDLSVVRVYLSILDSLGVECGLHKSLISHQGTAMEFAKRTYWFGHDVSPVPLKEFASATTALGASVEMIKKYNLSIAEYLQAMQVGWRVRSRLNAHIGSLPSRVRLLILAVNLPLTEEEATRFFELGAPRVANYKVDILSVMKEFATVENKRAISTLLRMSNGAAYSDQSDWAREEAAEAVLDALGITAQDPKGPRATLNSFAKEMGVLAEMKYPFRCLTDVLDNLARLTHFNVKVNIVKDAERLIKQLHNLKIDGNFAEFYLGFIKIQREISKINLDALGQVRPNHPEIEGILTPIQVRLWKRWSKVLQGTSEMKSVTDKP
nr:putative RNA-dependent RNA polymerase [Rhizoctonia solani mitovirus 114]